MAEFTDGGLIIDKIPDIRAKLQATAAEAFASLVPVGQSLDVDDSSIIGRIIGIVTPLLASQEEALQQLYASKDIEQATGTSLDDLAALGGVYRKLAQPASALLMLYGTLGTTILSGSKANSRITGDVFATQLNVTLNNTNCNAVECSLDNVGSAFTYVFGWTVDNSPNTNVTISVPTLSTDSVSVVGNKIVDAITSTTDNLLASYNPTTNLLTLSISNQNDTGSFALTGTTVVNVYKPVDAICNIVDKRPQDRNTITNIQTPVLGWLGVNNPFEANAGSSVQTDEEFRIFYHNTKAGTGASDSEAMYAEIRDVDGVRYVNIAENIYDVPLGGLLAHSFAPVVLGGDPQTIGQAILDNKPLGISTNGDITITAFDINGNPVDVKFSRPDLVPIKINMTLTIYPDFPDNGSDLIRQALIDYFNTLNVGEDVLYSRLFTPINSVRGFSVNSLEIARVAGVFNATTLEISYKELATLAASDITFGGV